jgi:predicted ATPase
MTSNTVASKFDELSIDGFRRLHDLHLTLRPLSVMIGANGTGKTSILEVLSLLANSAQGRLNESITELSSLSSVLACDGANSLKLGISMTVPGHNPLDYKLSIRPQGVAYVIEGETLRQARRGFDKPFMHIDSHGVDIKYYGVTDKKLITPN